MVVARAGRVRVAKDPKAFRDMDELREHLERGSGDKPQQGFISGAINFLSDAAFGAAGIQQPWWSPARIYRQLTQGLRFPGLRRGDDDDGFGPEDPNAPLTQQITACHKQLGPLLLMSRSDTRRMARKFPQVLTMPAADVAMRLVRLREALPGCDCCLLIEQNPRLFLSGDARETHLAVVAAAGKLRRALRGASVHEVIMADAELLFLPDLDHGLTELRDLWDVDEHAMAASEPMHLARAVRALSLTPKQPALSSSQEEDAVPATVEQVPASGGL